MHQHDMARRCQNRGLVLPRLGGADEAFCVLPGMKAERCMDDRVAHVKVGSTSVLYSRLISRVALWPDEDGAALVVCQEPVLGYLPLFPRP